MAYKKLEYGPVVISDSWFDEPRIGYYDDDGENDDDERCAIVYPGSMSITLDFGYYLVPYEFLRPVTTDDLWKRRQAIHEVLGPSRTREYKNDAGELKKRYELLAELSYVDGVLMDRMFEARFGQRKGTKEVFISHSSIDKQFAGWLAVDIANAGHKPWFDEWDIKVGESIPRSVNAGVTRSDFVIVILTENAVKSNWVENEWQAKYIDEIESGQIKVIPALFSDCRIPALLKTKKYADFRESYNDGFEDLMIAINS